MNGTLSSCCSDLPTDEAMDNNCNSVHVPCDLCDTLVTSECCVSNADQLVKSDLAPEASANVLLDRDCCILNMKHVQHECDVTTQDYQGGNHRYVKHYNNKFFHLYTI